jgi:alginate O-acetyltransferase complex protein AlgI
MVFSSVIFLFFFLPFSLIIYFLLPKNFRNPLLILLSLFFYWWGENGYVWVMIGSILSNFLFAYIVDHYRGRKAANIVLGSAVFFNLTLLAYFKYSDFFVSNLSAVFEIMGAGSLTPPGVHLPIGISFFTFQAISYVVDVYRKKEGPITRIDATALFISLFPQLIAGPIIRYHDVKDQLIRRICTSEKFSYGIHRFVIGLGKKVLIANTLAVAADAIFAVPTNSLSWGLAWIGIICYTLQIYHDFSGYSDMAIGLGHMLGFTFMENFNYPYIAVSIRDFWRRWHISLSSWFKDYLYLPLGGNRKGAVRTGFNLLIVFFLCGFWHGASWNFICWGLFHGLFLVAERGFPFQFRNGIVDLLRHIYVLMVVMVGWVFFRCETLSGAGAFLSAMFGLNSKMGILPPFQLFINNETLIAMFFGIIGATPLGLRIIQPVQGMEQPEGGNFFIKAKSLWHLQHTALLTVIFLGCAVKLSAGTYNPFIYFRF